MEKKTECMEIIIYQAPSMRIIKLSVEQSFLQSNTESIFDDGEEHGWD
jgi:hypothetical protein